MKAIFIYWLLAADGSGSVVVADMDTVNACYSTIGALWVKGTRPQPGARMECRPSTDGDALIGELASYRCAVEKSERNNHMITFACAGNK